VDRSNTKSPLAIFIATLQNTSFTVSTGLPSSPFMAYLVSTTYLALSDNTGSGKSIGVEYFFNIFSSTFTL